MQETVQAVQDVAQATGWDINAVRLIATAAVIMFGTMFPALSIGWIGSKAADAIGRNPEAAPKIQTAMILAIAFAEAIAIYALVVALIIKFV
ncbi:MAG: ATP synthase F0 subunit C [Patescibacteria group bacterium]